ncbi:MAG: AmpG family muropeptide MFS transporter [Gammaproteobacteria bacterium]|nr:AmpG family muropeptide MFS transporter [Gammaproteobacteria bacterium]
MLFLGFSAGLPFPLVFATLSAWLATAGISKSSIGMFAWVGMTYSLKFLWAPLVDRLPLPGLGGWLGRRRSWMLVAQAGVAAALVALAGADPGVDLARVALLSLAVAFCSATQDIAIDAWRIEAVGQRLQGAMAAAYQFGYRLAMLAAGAGALFVADLASWSAAYRSMAVLMLVGMITVFIIEEPLRGATAPAAPVGPQSAGGRLRSWFLSAVVGPFADFFHRNGAWGLVLLGFITCYRISDLILGVMANPFYIDIGFSLSQIATIAKVFGFGMTLAGAALGGVVVARWGAVRPLVAGAILVAGTNLLFAGLAWHHAPDLRFLMATISADNLAAGFAGTVFIAYLSGLTSVAYTATQYALFSALMTVLGNFIGGFSGVVVEASSWVSFFLYASAMGLPAIVLSLVVVRRAVAGQPPP